MPPRIPGPQGLSALNLCFRPATAATRLPAASSLQPLIQTANLSQQEKKRIRKQEPYRWAQIQARKTARVERQNEIQRERDAGWGDPVHGITTPFIESLDSVGQDAFSTPPKDAMGNPLAEPHPLPTTPGILAGQLTQQDVEEAINTAYQLSKPMPNTNRVVVDAISEENERVEHEERHRRAVTAIERIVSLQNSNSKAHTHANIQRCIDAFGRHNTDKVLRPKPRAPGLPPREELQRGGPDTGSPEVQIAILTAKIRVLAKMYEAPTGKRDKYNRRNLRLLCHRRQKLMKYLHRKERGSERWENLVKSLGLTPATWEKQISI